MEINPFDSETKLLWDNKVNIVSADALAPHMTRSSVAMALTMQDTGILVAISVSRYHNSIEIPIIDIRWSRDNLILNGNPFTWKDSLCIELGFRLPRGRITIASVISAWRNDI